MRKTKLVNKIIEGIQDCKGLGITVLDLRKIESAICDFFVICEGTSNTHVDSIADAIEDKTRLDLQEKPRYVEGRTNAIWVLLDYTDVIVHVFQKEAREFYAIETLWNDAKCEQIPNLE